MSIKNFGLTENMTIDEMQHMIIKRLKREWEFEGSNSHIYLHSNMGRPLPAKHFIKLIDKLIEDRVIKFV